jgi:hypothetical protein
MVGTQKVNRAQRRRIEREMRKDATKARGESITPGVPRLTRLSSQSHQPPGGAGASPAAPINDDAERLRALGLVHPLARRRR